MRGKICEIEFLDHSIEVNSKHHKPMKIKVWGKVKSLTKKVVVIYQWQLMTGDADTRRENNEVCKILLSTIVKIRFLDYIPEISSGEQ
jgi:hypothetical protein